MTGPRGSEAADDLLRAQTMTPAELRARILPWLRLLVALAAELANRGAP
jgi:hypothetical protein